MSDNIPFEIQEDIMKRLPVKSLIQFRSVSKALKSLIDSADFIKQYSGQMQHVLAKYKDRVDFEVKYVIIADDDAFPHHKVSVVIPSVDFEEKYSYVIGCSHGLLFLYTDHHERSFSGTRRALIWNPSIRKAVVVDVPNVAEKKKFTSVLGFGVCGETTDPKIVKITQAIWWRDGERITPVPRHVEVFTLSTGVWKSPRGNLPRKSIYFHRNDKVAVDGVLYWLAIDRIIIDSGRRSYNLNLIVSFDMTSEVFREVNLPDSLARESHYELSISKLRESLVVLEKNYLVFSVWMMEDDVSKPFTKLFNINIPAARTACLLGFRKTGEPIIDTAMYEPISNLGINGRSFFVSSYIETLLLL